MLCSFSVSNYLSFRDKQTLALYPEALKEHKEYLHTPYLHNSDEKLLKSIALYGHNSFGKSNFIKAYHFYRSCIFNSFVFGKTDGYIEVDNFRLNTDMKGKPSEFQSIFILRQTKYRYRFLINDGKVIEEELFYSEPKVRENYLFIRVQSEIRVSKTWNKEAKGRIEESIIFTKSFNLFLSVLVSQEGIPRINDIVDWFKGNIILSDEIGVDHIEKVVLILKKEAYRSTVQKFIENGDLGFITIIEKLDSYTNNKLSLDKNFLNLLYEHEISAFELYTKHDVYNKDYKKETEVLFDLLKHESSGSIKYFILACYLTFVIKESQLIWVDEIDSKLHTSLLQMIIKVFNDAKINIEASQMIFTLHNTSILSDEILRRDQILFVDKNKYGESSLIKMHTPERPIRAKSSFEKAYLKGELAGTSKKVKKNLDSKQIDLDF
jgi:uncharacterized protein